MASTTEIVVWFIMNLKNVRVFKFHWSTVGMNHRRRTDHSKDRSGGVTHRHTDKKRPQLYALDCGRMDRQKLLALPPWWMRIFSFLN